MQAITPTLASVLTVNNSANNNKITNLANPVNVQDAATKGYTDAGYTQLQSLIGTLQAQITALQNAAPASLTNFSIGSQIWQNTNLDVTTYRDGTPIPQVTDPTQWANLTTGAWCYYNNDPANNSVYGKLYNWYAVAGIHDNDPNTPNKILAPTGWHVPTDDEWTTLSAFLGGASVAGGKMKATGISLWASPNVGATNSSGFNGLPGGVRNNYAEFLYVGTNGFWWSSSEYDFTGAWPRDLYFNTGDLYRNVTNKGTGWSVRCVKD